MTPDSASQKKSCLDLVDPRYRVMVAIIYSILVAVLYNFPALFASMAVSLAWLSLSGIPLRQVAKRLRPVTRLLILFWILLSVTFSGEFMKIGYVGLSRDGVILASTITLKSYAILCALIALISPLSMITLGHAMNRLGFPDKLVYLMLLCVRYLFVIEQEYKKILTAIKIRGFVPKTSLHTYKTYAYIIGMLFIRANRRAERVYCAMLCRGFSGKFHSLTEFPETGKSMIFLMSAILISIFLVVMEIIPHIRIF